jgi:hypothetical protein
MITTQIDQSCSGRGSRGLRGVLHDVESWFDERGRFAWIMAVVVALVVFWPIGLALLAYTIWTGRMSSGSRGMSHRQGSARSARAALRASGNSAFDAYKAETLRRLEDEQKAFEDFLARLRAARDKAEFDAFIQERATKANGTPDDDGDGKAPAGA